MHPAHPRSLAFARDAGPRRQAHVFEANDL
jgi:hypothetical protein